MAALNIVGQRLYNQHLVGAPLETPEEVVRQLCAVQSQDYAGAKWALGQRLERITDADIDALYNAGKILRTHVMRPTWHFVHPEDIRWLLSLTAPRVHAANAYYYRKFGLTGAVLKSSEAAIAKALRGGNRLTRAELARTLKAAGIIASGLQLGYILMSAELNAVICNGALKGKQHTYALLDERVPDAKSLPRDQALVELTKRYFASHGPAQVRDYVWWSGLTVAEAKDAIADAQLTPFEQDGTVYWLGSSVTAKEIRTSAHLLPNYDEYLIAYKDRSAYSIPFAVAPHADIFNRHILVIGGKVAGAWRETTTAKAIRLVITPLVSLGKTEIESIHAAAQKYGHFIGRPVELVCPG